MRRVGRSPKHSALLPCRKAELGVIAKQGASPTSAFDPLQTLAADLATRIVRSILAQFQQ